MKRSKKTKSTGDLTEIETRILQYISSSEYRPKRVRALARSMGIPDQEYGRFRDAVKALMKSGRLVVGRGNAVLPPPLTGKIVGVYRANPKGFGFVVPEDPTSHADLYIPPGKAMDAITGDVVLAEVVRKRRGRKGLYEGRIVEILQRGQNRFVGELQKEDRKYFVVPDGKTLHSPIMVSDVTAKAAKPGDQVVVEIISYPAPGKPARGVIVEVLGKRGDPGIDIKSIIRQYHLPEEFPEEVLQEARQIVSRFDPEAHLPERLDLRNETIITIDPADARDFDDAISLRKLPDGTWELGVHIADVSAFVTEKSALDEEARNRGNSVYFPRYVIPMLPEVLSNGLCSLQPGEPRPTKSVFIRYDEKGKVLSQRFANSVITSAARLTYEDAQAMIDGNLEAVRNFPPEVIHLVQDMALLARRIQQRRLRRGMLSLDIPEVELILDGNGKVIDAKPADTSFSHTVIEMFMVEANEAVARLLDRLDVPFLRRVHPEPAEPEMQQLRQSLQVLGYRLPAEVDRRSLQKLLDAVRGKPESYAVNLAVLRSMQQAEYSPERIGHYALASEHYCHFTSPIRRYPDLTVHRLLDRYLAGRLKSEADRRSVPSFNELESLGRHCSYTERRAEDAEHELKTVKILELLSERIGDVIDAVVTGVTNFGVFAQCRKFLIDGLIRFDNLPDDWWEVDAKAGTVFGIRSGRQIRIGDPVKVQITAVNVPTRQLDLSLAEQPDEDDQHEPPPSRRSQRTARRKKHRSKKRAR